MTRIWLAHVVDWGGLLLVTFGPIPIVRRWRRRGVVLAAIGAWGVLILSGELLNALDPRRDAAMLDHIWILFGWIATLAYCAAIHAGFGLVPRLRGSIQRTPEAHRCAD